MVMAAVLGFKNQMKSYEDTNDVMSMENKFDNFLKNFSNSGGNAGNMIVGNINASN